MSNCRICNNESVRVYVAQYLAQVRQVDVVKLTRELNSKFQLRLKRSEVAEHIDKHENWVAPWLSTGYRFESEEQRRVADYRLLAQTSLAMELWDKYNALDRAFKMLTQAMDGGDDFQVVMLRTKLLSEVGKTLKDYLTQLLKLQQERDMVIEVIKAVLLMLADNLMKRLSGLLADLPLETRRAVGLLLKEEVKKAVDYAKSMAKNDGKIEGLIKQVEEAYGNLVSAR